MCESIPAGDQGHPKNTTGEYKQQIYFITFLARVSQNIAGLQRETKQGCKYRQA